MTLKNTRILMTVLVIASISATLAFAQTSEIFVSEKSQSAPTGALFVGNVKVTQFDVDGNIIAYRQSENHIVETGMQILMGQLFNTQNDTYTVPSRPLSHMEIGSDGEWQLFYNDTDVRAPMDLLLGACLRVPFFDIDNSTESGGGVSTTWGPDRSPGTCTAPNCAAQMNVTAQASFSGAQCGGSGATIDEAGIFTDSAAGQMFARNTFGSVVLNVMDTLQLDWEFTFTDTVP